MVYAPVWSVIPSLKLRDYMSIQAHKPCSISHVTSLHKFLVCPVSSATYLFDYETGVSFAKESQKSRSALTLITRKQTAKFMSADFQNILSQSNLVSRIQRLEGKQCGTR